ncbi:MAG: alkaline phosphatase family protein [Solirubrobacteraceae bacterium]
MREPPGGIVITRLREVRLSRLALAVVAAISGLATALVIATALGRTSAQSAATAALRHPPVIVRVAASRPAPEPAAAPAADPSPAAAPVDTSADADVGADSGAQSSAPPATGDSSPASAGTTAPATTGATTTTTPTTTTAPQPKVGHVFMIALSTTSFEAAFGQQSVARYLNTKLRPRGTFLGGYETLAGSELPDYLALISGQAPNDDTLGGCSTYAEFPAKVKPSVDGQVPGPGCVYPNTITTLADQVTSAGHTWKAYIEDLDRNCVHPNSDALDNVPLPGAGPQYDTRHNPFIYFHSLLDLGGCDNGDGPLSKLRGDLRSSSKTATFSFVAPRACDDAAVATCPDGQPAGLAGEDTFLRKWVPAILGSAAYKHDGVLIVTFALTGAAAPGGPVPTGALVLSRFAKAGKTVSATYNPYSVLRSIEDLLGYKPLAHATSARSFVSAVLPEASASARK